MKRLPIGVSSFKKMINDDFLYIDKTQEIYKIITGSDYIFLSRPRRFGKSLLISTLQEIFNGNRDLFEGLWIDKHTNYSWVKYPIIHLDLSGLSHETSQEFKIDLEWKINQIAKNNNINLEAAPSLSTKFNLLIEELSKINQVVILVDEYDAPLLNNIDNIKTAKAIQKIMKSFFSILKIAEKSAYLRYVAITGVTKFAKTSIFSGLNNLNDISLDSKAASLLGYTDDELKIYFDEHAKAFSEKEQASIKKIFEIFKDRYNGYRFSESEITVYNPFSVLQAFEKQKFSNYWLETGTPSFLIELLKTQYHDLENIETSELSNSSLGTFDLGEVPLIPILFQSGYLTIIDYLKKEDKYILDYPNEEVRTSFKKYIFSSLTQINPGKIDIAALQLKKSLEENDIDSFCTILTSLLANVPHQLHIKKEAYYHSLLHFLLDFLGFENQSEISSSTGRIDMVIALKKRIIIIEFKFKATSKKALEQICKRKYYEKYLRYKKPITLVGISFSLKNKQLILDFVKKDLV